MTVRERVQAYAAYLRAKSAVLKGKERYVAAAVLLFIFIPFYLLFTPPAGFPKGQLISIPADSASDAIASQLASEHAVRSAFQMKVLARLTGQDRALQSGIYVFDTPIGLVPMLARLANGEHGIAETRVTLTEGMTAKEMTAALAQVPGFDTDAFMRAASTSEGYLFPDTYFILPGTTAEEMVQRLRAQFDTKIATIQPQIDSFGASLSEDVIMASILEREAKSPEDKRMVAGILYNRLKIGMALQVDAAPSTYDEPGLPPAPIANPGLTTILAAVTPEKTAYIYYITGHDGLMHYAKTFEQHKANISKYLK